MFKNQDNKCFVRTEKSSYAWLDTLNSLNEILEAYESSNNFDEELFEKNVVGITVNSNADLTFKLIGDIELTEKIPMKGRCRRRENS